MAALQMQARSSVSLAIVTWNAAAPDFAAVGFPGPGVAQDVAVSMRPGAVTTGVTATLPFLDPRAYGTLAANSSGAGATNVAAINAAIVAANAASVALTGPCEVLLPAGKFWIAGTITMLSGVTLRGAGEGKTYLYMPAASYTNTTWNTRNSTSLAIDASGQLVTPYAKARNIKILDLTIESQVSDGRVLYGIRASNVDNLEIARVEILGIPVGNAIEINTVLGSSSVHHCHVHDCGTSVTTYGTQPQMTGIEIDNNKVDGNLSRGVAIHDNSFIDLMFAGLALSNYGAQTDGINAAHGISLRIHDNYARNVGEGIDLFALDCNVSGNALVDCYHAGIKLIHGAVRNNVHGNSILRPGRAGVVLEGRSAETRANFIHGNHVHDVNSSHVWDAQSNAAFLIVSGAGIEANDNTICGNKVTGGANMDYVIRNEAGTGNRFYDNEAEAWLIDYSSVSGGTATIAETSWQPNAKFPTKGKLPGIELVEHFTSVAAMHGLQALVSGTAASVTDEDNDSGARVGIANCRTGTDTTGRSGLITRTNALRFGGGRHRLRWDAFLTALSDGTNTYTSRIGFLDSVSGEATNGAFFRYTHGTNGGRWQAVTRAAGTETATDTGVAAAAAWAYFEIEVNAAGTSVAFYINGTLVATNTTNIPTGGNLTGIGTAHIKSAGATSREFRFDMMAYSFEPTALL